MRGNVEVKADRSYRLRLTTNVLCDFEEIAQRPFADVAVDFASGRPRMTDVRLLLSLGLSPQVDLRQAGEVIDAVGVAKSIELVVTAIAAAFPDKDTAQGNVPEAE